MKFEISDEQALLVSGLGCAAFSTFALVAPDRYQSTFMAKAQPYSEPMVRWFGEALTAKAATDIVLSRSDANGKALKGTLKVTGVAWLSAAATMAYRAQDGTHNRELAIASAVGQALVGALCLQRGFADD